MFYTYRQNNSGGRFIQDKSVAGYVIIEASNLGEAHDKAEDVGIYFDGCDKGRDCPCCGDRWSRYADAARKPKIYGKEPIKEVGTNYFGLYCIIYYKNGKKEIIKPVKKENKGRAK